MRTLLLQVNSKFCGTANFRDRYPDLGVRAGVRPLSPPNLVLFHGEVWRTKM